jgi:phage head maturation protease
MMRQAQRKSLSVSFKQGGPEGSFTATFARFGQVDLDGDVTLEGAFELGAKVRLTQFGHNWDVYTIGTGTIGADSKRAWIDGQFNLRTTAGRDHYESIKDAGDLQQFSYGYDPIDASTDRAELARYPGAKRILKKVLVHEVSPVMLGAGDSGLESIKSATTDELDDDDDSIEMKSARAAIYVQAVEYEQRWDAETEPGEVTYYHVLESKAAPHVRDNVGRFLTMACDELGIERPARVGFFEPATRGAAFERKLAVDYLTPLPIFTRFRGVETLRGKSYVREREIWLRSDLSIEELPGVIAHEAAHLTGPDAADLAAEGSVGALKRAYIEAQCDAFEDRFVSKLRPPRVTEADEQAVRRKAAADRLFRGSLGEDLQELAQERRAWLARNGQSA